MENKYLKLVFSLFFCIIFFCINNMVVFADSTANLTMGSNNMTIFYEDSELKRVTASPLFNASKEFSGVSYSNFNNFTEIEKTIVNTFCSRFQLYMGSEEDKEKLGDYLISEMTITYDPNSRQNWKPVFTGALSHIVSETTDIINSESSEYKPYSITFTIESPSGKYSYNFTFFTAYYGLSVERFIDADRTKTCTETKYISKDQIRNFCENPESDIKSITPKFDEEDYKILETQYKIAQDTLKGVEDIYEALELGLIAGSIGSGYNVGTVYSTTQISLADAMTEDESGNGYDFKNQNALKTAFAYYMNPLLGKVEFLSDGSGEKSAVIPTDIAGWKDKVSTLNPDFINDHDVVINSEFTAFESGLSEDAINANGLKKTKKANFTNGVKALTDVGTSKTPGSVISYNMKIAYPYIFYKVGNNYKLHTKNLKLEEDYQYCIYDDYIRDNEFNKITNRDSIGISRDQLFLYYQFNSEGQYIGVLLIGSFDEGVIDTSEADNGRLYATGRKIGFNNGYSDLLVFNDANPMLMYSTSDGGKKGYLPKNAAFLLDDTEVEVVMNNMTVHPQAIVEGKAEFLPLTIPSNKEILNDLKSMGNHDVINTEPQMFKFNIVFTQIINETGSKDAEEINEANGTSDPLTDKEKEEMGLSHYAFVMLRNNRYINDAELIAWLKTNNARSIPYVDAEGLLDKITGDFLDGLEKLTYEDWLSMQNIKSELENNKDMWLIRVLNVMAIVMGVFLIIFAILICLAYWIDIFNTLADFSILQFISFGNLYPVENKDLIPYVSESKSSTKYVTFKDVLIIAGICCGIGIIFMNTFTLVSWIVYLYNYIMTTLGGV